MKFIKDRLINIIVVLSAVTALLILNYVASQQEAPIKPHIFYHGSVYYQEVPVKEYDLDQLLGTLVEDGTIHSLLDDTEVCSCDYQTNRPHYLGARIYKLQDGSLDDIYVQLSTPDGPGSLLRFYKA